jgi:molybdenum cofactor guanylyltransferase
MTTRVHYIAPAPGPFDGQQCSKYNGYMNTLAIQAGGRSSRMGRDKALVPLRGRPLIEHVLARLAPLADEVLITTNHSSSLAYLGVRLVPDRQPGAGALQGLQTALLAAGGERVLLVACDMPFVVPALAIHLLNTALQADVVIPQRRGEFEPMLAVYSRRCLPAVEHALAAGQQRMISFFPNVEVHSVDEADWQAFDRRGLSFFNINSPEKLTEAEHLLKEMASDSPPPTGN